METLSNWTTIGPRTEFEAQTGIWTNWSRGHIMGATLTLSRQNGNLLIAFTAFFIGLVSSRFWRIFCFLLHRYYSTQRINDAFHHQRQAVLRNSPNPESGLWTFAQLAWAWRRSARRALVRALPGLVWAATSLAAFTVASGFSSRVSTGINDEVLIKPGSCGYVNNIAAGMDLANFDLLLQNQAQQTSAAANYAQQCYTRNSTGVFNCNYFAINRLPTTLDSNALCPFAPGTCRSDRGNIRLDTGYLDSHDHFGINAPPDERILFRHIMQCAPLNTVGFESNVGRNYTRYYYGPGTLLVNGSVELIDWTYETRNLEYQYNQGSNTQNSYGRTYQLVTMRAQAFNGSVLTSHSDFITADGLKRSDADVVLYFLSGNGIQYVYKTDDPWYRGILPGVLIGGPLSNATMSTFQPEEAASPMGCTEQFQFCNANNQRCGPLAGYFDAIMGAGPLFGLLPEEVLFNFSGSDPAGAQSRFLWFGTAIPSGRSSYATVSTLGPQALLSAQGLDNGFQGPLPVDQWKRDVAYWWATTMALLQATATDVVRGPPADLQTFSVLPRDDAQKALCVNQKVRTTAYTSFSLFGLYFIFVAGIFIVLMSYIIEPIFACLQRNRAYEPYKLCEWQTSEPLQLQRIAYQTVGQGTWSRFTDNVPLESGGELLEPLALHYGDPDVTPRKP